MRVLMLTAVGLFGATALSAAAEAQYRYGYYPPPSNHDYREAGKAQREYQRELAEARRDCREELREADNRREWIEAQRECRQELAEVQRDYQKELREAHGAYREQWRDAREDRRDDDDD